MTMMEFSFNPLNTTSFFKLMIKRLSTTVRLLGIFKIDLNKSLTQKSVKIQSNFHFNLHILVEKFLVRVHILTEFTFLL